MVERKAGWCALCKSRCGATFELENGRLIGAGPLPGHPTGKSLCVKGRAAPEILYSKERILHPLKRTRAKSEDDPGWVEISWEEALGIIGENLRTIRAAHGPEGIAFSTTTPSGTAISDADDWIERLIRLSGSPNWVSTTEICNWHRDSTHALTIGTALPYPDWDRTDLVVLWGFNPTTVWLDQATQVAAARARGARVMVIDPRRFGFGNGADYWLRVRPGADGILAMGILRRLIETGAYDHEFLRQWTNGAFLVRDDGEFLRGKDVSGACSDAAYVVSLPNGGLGFVERHSATSQTVLADALLSSQVLIDGSRGPIRCRTSFDHLRDAAMKYTLNEVSELTWVPFDDIVAAADALGAAPSVAYYTWGGLSQHTQATQIDRALATLMSFKGCFDAPGGNLVLPEHPINKLNRVDLLESSQLQKAVGLTERPLGPPSVGRIVAHDFYDAVLEGCPYPVRALVAFGSNLAVAHANSNRGREALQALDFYVHCDLFENPSAKCADIVLPVNTAYERDALRIGFGSGLAAQEHVQYRHALVESQGESKSDAEIVMYIANELRLSSFFFNGDIDAGRAFILEPLGVDLDFLKANPGGIRLPLKHMQRKYEMRVGDRVRGFDTESGQVELYSALLHRHAQPAVPNFDVSKLPGNDTFPFVLTTAKSGHFCHSQHRQIVSLRKREKDPTVNIAPESGEAVGLNEGDWTYIETQSGRIKMRVKYDATLDSRVVRASYGWWQENEQLRLPGYDPFQDSGSNYNLLIDNQDLDPVSGSAGHRSQSCRLVPVKELRAWRGFVPMRVAQIRKVVEDVTTVFFEPIDDRVLPDYEPGQHLAIRIKRAEGGDQITRCYSLVGPAVYSCRTAYQIAVRLVSRDDTTYGKMSGHINRLLKEGDFVEVLAPKGDFLPELRARRPVVLVAGGIGITPFLSYLETVAHLEEKPRIHLAYVNRSSKFEAFLSRILELHAMIPTMTLARYWSSPGPEIDGSVVTGHVQVENLLCKDFATAPSVYMCGPSGMTDGIRRGLIQLGHPSDLIFEESFVGAAADPSKLPTGPYTVTFARSGRTAEWRQGIGSLLELAESAKVEIANGCRAGQCGTCEVSVISGECMYRSEISHPGGDRYLACQAVPISDIMIDA